MGGVTKLIKRQDVSKMIKEVASPVAQQQAATATTRESAEQKAATRRASRRGGMRGLLSQERLGGEQSTLGSVVQ